MSGEGRPRNPSVDSPEEGQHEDGGAAASFGATMKSNGVAAPSHSIGGERSHRSKQYEIDEKGDASPLSSRKPNETGDKDNVQFLGGHREEHRRGVDQTQLATPPWLTPGCARSIKPWRTLLGMPWPAGTLPDFSTVFSHQWTANDNGTAVWGGGGGGAGTSTVAAATATLATSVPWSVESSSVRSPVSKPGTLLRTILRLVAGEPTVLTTQAATSTVAAHLIFLRHTTIHINNSMVEIKLILF